MNDLIDRQTVIETAIEAADKWDGGYSSEREGIIRKFFDKVPAVQPDHNADISEINKFIDCLEEIFAGIREQHVDDSVCGLCEYDGAYMGQSGDWCNECPGFDKDDCFKLSDETRKKWIEEIVNTYPDHTADIGKKVSISCGQENDLISRQAALDAIIGQPPEPHYPSWYAAQIEKLPAAQPATNCSEIPNGSDDTISRQAAIARAVPLNLFGREVMIVSVSELENLPSAQPEQRWVPCSERLPEKNCRCLTTNEAWGSFEVDWNAWIDGQWLYPNEKPIAWMPLPEPYRGGDSE